MSLRFFSLSLSSFLSLSRAVCYIWLSPFAAWFQTNRTQSAKIAACTNCYRKLDTVWKIGRHVSLVLMTPMSRACDPHYHPTIGNYEKKNYIYMYKNEHPAISIKLKIRRMSHATPNFIHTSRDQSHARKYTNPHHSLFDNHRPWPFFLGECTLPQLCATTRMILDAKIGIT